MKNKIKNIIIFLLGLLCVCLGITSFIFGINTDLYETENCELFSENAETGKKYKLIVVSKQHLADDFGSKYNSSKSLYRVNNKYLVTVDRGEEVSEIVYGKAVKVSNNFEKRMKNKIKKNLGIDANLGKVYLNAENDKMSDKADILCMGGMCIIGLGTIILIVQFIYFIARKNR